MARDVKTLLNATDEDVYVLTAAGPVLLAQVREPEQLEAPVDGDAMWVASPDGSGEILELDLHRGVKVYGRIHTPPRLDGVLYLVTEETLAAYRDRDDFVVASTYLYDSDRDDRVTLSGVTRHPHAPIGVANLADITAELLA